MRIGGLEPPLLSEQDPKSCAATNYAISAWAEKSCKDTHFFSNSEEKFNFHSLIIFFLVRIPCHFKQSLREMAVTVGMLREVVLMVFCGGLEDP